MFILTTKVSKHCKYFRPSLMKPDLNVAKSIATGKVLVFTSYLCMDVNQKWGRSTYGTFVTPFLVENH